jgi:hypothetical protein
MDCQDDLPGEHSATADLLGRTGGWIQLEVWSATVGVSTGKRAHTVTDMEAFGFAVSSFVDGPTPDSDAYGSIPASTAAVADFQREQTQMHLVPVASPAAIPSGVQWLEKDQRPYVEVAAAFPIGNDDVEAIAVCQHCTAAQKHDMGTRFAAALMALWGRQ